MQKILLKIKYFESGLSESIEKVNFIFPFKSRPLVMYCLTKFDEGKKLQKFEYLRNEKSSLDETKKYFS